MEFRIAGIKSHSTVDGPGIRTAIFFQGCNHKCPGCHNPETWDKDKGDVVSTTDIINQILSDKFIDGVTFTGGDPLMQSSAATIIAKALKEKSINIWCYTGYTFEEIKSLKAGKDALELLNYIDTLVDGRFVLSKKSSECIFRGSTNQRLIDVKESLKQNNVIEQKEFDFGL